MKKFMLSIAALAVFVMAPMWVLAADAKTVKGEPIDIKCYMGGKSGPDHAGCGTSCVKKGMPIGLVVEEGGKKVVYLVITGGDKLFDHVGHQVNVTGKVSSKDGINTIEVTEAKM